VLVFILTVSQGALAGQQQVNSEYLEAVKQFVVDNYYYDLPADQIESANDVSSIFSRLDEYSEFYTPEKAQQLLNLINWRYAGIGIEYTQIQDEFVVFQVFRESPAFKAGIKAGDRILKVDGNTLQGLSLSEVEKLLKGEEGSTVSLEIYRAGEPRCLDISLTREIIDMDSVFHIIRGDTGYIAIGSFGEGTFDSFCQAYQEIKDAGVKKIILDLRNNSGGQVDQAIAIARLLVPKGVITTILSKDRENDRVYYSYREGNLDPLVVLVNENTASAAEILAGAIKDRKAGVLIGETTFGKGRVQTFFPFLSEDAFYKYEYFTGHPIVDALDLREYGLEPRISDLAGWAKITTNVYRTPAGTILDGNGLKPDIEVDNPDSYYMPEQDYAFLLSQTNKYYPGTSGLEIYFAEKILNRLGYDIADPDLVYDQHSSVIVQKFQVDEGLYPSGIIDYATQERLNRELEKQVMAHDPQLARARQVFPN